MNINADRHSKPDMKLAIIIIIIIIIIIKRSERKAEHSHPDSAEVKSEWN